MTAQTAHRGQTIVPLEKGIVRTSPEFTDGVCCGYLYYYDECARIRLADTDIGTQLNTAIHDTRYTEIWLTGFLVGWVEALIEDRDLFGVVASA